MPVREIDVLITDASAPQQLLLDLCKRGVQVIVASEENR